MGVISVSVRKSTNAPSLEFEAVFPSSSGSDWQLQLPCWRPGRYELGNFAQYITKMVGINDDGSEVKLEKLNHHRWQIPENIRTMRWTFYANILNAGSTYVRDDLQYVNPVNCLVYEVGAEDVGYEICLCDVPSEWKLATALPYSVVDGNFVMKARDMQHLMDCPWMAAPELWNAEYKVVDEEKEVDFYVWSYGCKPPNAQKFVEDHIAFSKSQIAYFRTFPTPFYHFLYLLPPEIEVRHGVEHEDSTVIVLGPENIINSDYGYDELISIGSHELYHAWNVKRIRPSEWTPYDFTKACPSQLGYIAEGVTTYMGDLFLFEAGCIDLENWCSKMEVLLTRHLNNQGRLNMSVADSSYDTWLDGYRPGVPGRKCSIYVEGAVLAFLCDCRIMKVSGHKQSLSTAMTILWDRFGKSRKGLTAEEYWGVLEEVAGESLNDLRTKYAYGIADSWNDLVEAMDFKGLKLEKSSDEKGFVTPKISEL
tara:strand:- start:3495 stop:4934 length:1440 start_codon:yes stop_codon:yes gene_type:complete